MPDDASYQRVIEAHLEMFRSSFWLAGKKANPIRFRTAYKRDDGAFVREYIAGDYRVEFAITATDDMVSLKVFPTDGPPGLEPVGPPAIPRLLPKVRGVR